MGLTNRIEVIDRDGWHKEVTVEKSIVYIGSAQHNDLYLDPQHGSGVAPTHAQMIFTSETAGCQLVNLATKEILIGGETRLAPEESAELATETMIQLGDFTLLFHGSLDSPSGGGQNAGRNLSLSVFLPANRLEAGRTLTGTVRVRNLGSESGVQVDLDIEGLDAGCFSIEPGPVLAAGAERDIHFRIHHRGSKPAAGRCQFAIRAAARRAYSGEEIVSIQTIQVASVYDYGLQIIPPAGATAASVSPSPLLVQDGPKVQPPSVSSPAAEAQLNTVWSEQLSTTQLSTTGPQRARETAVKPVLAAPPQQRPIRLGISGLTITPEICKAMDLPEQQTGVLVVAVTEGSLAAQAGLRGGDRVLSVLGQQLMLGGDVITRINDQPVRRVEDQAAILAAAYKAGAQPREGLRINLLRGGAAMDVEVRLGLSETETPRQEIASQEVASEQVVVDTALSSEGATSASAPGEEAPGEETSQLSTTGQETFPPEPANIQSASAQEAQPADVEPAVVKITNKAKPSTQQLSAPKAKQTRLAASATRQAGVTPQVMKKVPQVPKPAPRAAAEATQQLSTTEAKAGQSWWSPAVEEVGEDAKPPVIQIKARPASPSSTRQVSPAGAEKSKTTAESGPKSQDWWTDAEDKDEA